jgi:DNA-binding NarL/FixJ family response regulator
MAASAIATSNAEIAIILEIAPRTVEKHVEFILRKLSTDNRTTAAVMLVQSSA